MKRFLLAIAVSAGSLLVAQTAAKTALPKIDDKLLFHYVKYMERWPDDAELKVSETKASRAMPGMFEVTVQLTGRGRVLSERHYFVTRDGSHFLKGDAFEIAQKPFEDRIKRLSRQSSPSIGPANAPVTISLFEDFQCPDCADAGKLFTDQLPAEFGDKLRVVFHDFPLPQHAWAARAAIAGRCAFRSSNELFWSYYRWIFAHQKDIQDGSFAAMVTVWAEDTKADEKFAACVETRATEKEVNDSIADGVALELQGTPSVLLNGRTLPMLFPNGLMVPPDTQFSALKWLVQFELKVVPPADACCIIGPH